MNMHNLVMAHLRSVLITAMLLCAFAAHAATTFVSANLWFTSSDGRTASVTGYNGGSTVVIPPEVTYGGVTYTVTSITSLDNKRSYEPTMTQLIIPATVTKLENESFDKCTSLSEIVFEPGDTPLTVGLSVTHHGAYIPAEALFSKCPLKSITLGRQLVLDPQRQDYGDLYTLEKNPDKWAYSPFYGQTISTMLVTNAGIYFPSYFFKFTLETLYLTAAGTEFRGDCMPDTPGSNVKTIYAQKPFSLAQGCDFTPETVDLTDADVWLQCTFAAPVGAETKVLIAGNVFDTITIPEGTTEIADYAFANQQLSRITIPTSVKRIGTGSFMNCKFSTVSLPEVETIGDKAFSGGKLATVTFGSAIKEIGSDAFSNNPMTVVSFPSSLTAIGDNAFRNCGSLTTVSFVSDGNLKSIGKSAFELCGSLTAVRLPKGLETIGEYSFSRCGKLTYIDMGQSITRVADGAFSGCTALSEVTLPNTVKSVGRNAFSSCVGITVLSLNEGLETIESGAFSWLSGLPSLTIPSSVKRIEASAFEKTTRLAYLTFADGDTPLSMPDNNNEADPLMCGFWESPLRVVHLGRDIVDYPEIIIFGKAVCSPFYEMSSITKLTIGPKVTKVGSKLFEGCSGIKSVVCGKGLRTIDTRAFARCTSLTEVSLNEGLSELGQAAFDGCAGLTALSFPSTLAKIGDYAFSACTGITEVKFVDSAAAITIGKGSTAGEALFCDTKLAKAYVGRDMNVTYSPFYHNSTLAEISFSDAYVTRLYDSYLENCTSVKSIKLPESLRGIGNSAMRGMTALGTLAIPAKVRDIGEYAFYGCTALESATMGNAVAIGSYAFGACTAMKSCKLSAMLRTLGEHLFDGDKALLTIDIPASVSDIGSYAFSGCESLDNITLPDKLETLKPYVFNNTLSLSKFSFGKGVTTVESYAMNNCPAIVNLTVPANVTEIKAFGLTEFSGLENIVIEDGDEYLYVANDYGPNTGMFSDCPLKTVYLGRWIPVTIGYAPFVDNTTLQQLTIGPSCKVVDKNAFKGCVSLASLEIPDNVTTLGAAAFAGCKSMASLSLGSGLVSMGAGVFEDCTDLRSATIAPGLLELAEGAFRGCTSLSSVDFGSIETVGPEAFMNCQSLREIKLPTSIFGIGVRSFKNSGLVSLEIPEGPRNIGQESFYGCESLRYITLSKTVTSIGLDAFGVFTTHDQAIEWIKSYNTTPPEGLAGFTEETEKSATLYVPAPARELYANSYTWENFFNVKTLDDWTPGVTAISLDRSEVTIYNGQTLSVNATVTDDDNLALIWEVADPDIVTVQATDDKLRSVKITPGIKAGTTTITAKAGDGSPVSATATVSYVASEPPTVNATEIVLKYKEVSFYTELSLLDRIEPEEATDRNLVWTSSDPNVATVDETGLVRVVSPGFAEIKVTNGNIESVCKVQALNITQERIKVPLGKTTVLPWPFTTDPVYTVPFELEVVNTSLGTVNNEREFTALAVGSTSVRDSRGQILYYIDVFDPETLIDIVCVENVYYKVDGQTKTAFVTGHYIDPSLPEYTMTKAVIKAEVEYSGIVFPVTKFGSRCFYKTPIRKLVIEESATPLTLDYSQFESVALESVTINRPIELETTSPFYRMTTIKEVVIGGEVTEIPELAFYGCTALTDVTIGEKVSAIGRQVFGECNIANVTCQAGVPPTLNSAVFTSETYSNATLRIPASSAKAYSEAEGWKNFIHIELMDAVKAEGISLSETEHSAHPGESFTLTATVLPENASVKEVEWTTSDASVATVDSEGCVTVTGTGTCHITATTTDGTGLSASCLVMCGISGIESVMAASGGRADIYSLSGLLLIHNATADDFKRLGSGVYIVCGQKILKK